VSSGIFHWNIGYEFEEYRYCVFVNVLSEIVIYLSHLTILQTIVYFCRFENVVEYVLKGYMNALNNGL
jgi:hypothetical protein